MGRKIIAVLSDTHGKGFLAIEKKSLKAKFQNRIADALSDYFEKIVQNRVFIFRPLDYVKV